MSIDKNRYTCPILGDIMRNPYKCADGYSYDFDNIARWLDDKTTSPMTRQNLYGTLLKPDVELRNEIKKYFNISVSQSTTVYIVDVLGSKDDTRNSYCNDDLISNLFKKLY